MPTAPHSESDEPLIEFHLLGQIDFDDALTLQRRLVYERGNGQSRSISVLLCEHSPLITIGRSGSRSHIRLNASELTRRGLATRWLNRGGGCILHNPGQLAVYPIVPLDAMGWTAGGYLARLQEAVVQAFSVFRVDSRTRPSSHGVWGRSGMLAAVGVGVQQSTTNHGVFINVSPAMSDYGFVDTGAPYVGAQERATMSCLLAERRLPVRMASVRAALIESLTASFEGARHNIHTGHPWLRHLPAGSRDSRARAS